MAFIPAGYDLARESRMEYTDPVLMQYGRNNNGYEELKQYIYTMHKTIARVIEEMSQEMSELGQRIDELEANREN